MTEDPLKNRVRKMWELCSEQCQPIYERLISLGKQDARKVIEEMKAEAQNTWEFQMADFVEFLFEEELENDAF